MEKEKNTNGKNNWLNIFSFEIMAFPFSFSAIFSLEGRRANDMRLWLELLGEKKKRKKDIQISITYFRIIYFFPHEGVIILLISMNTSVFSYICGTKTSSFQKMVYICVIHINESLQERTPQ